MKTQKTSGSHNAHARLAPSGSKTWVTCTGSPALAEANAHRIPKDTGSIYSNEGTVCHDHAADLLTGKVKAEDIPEDFREYVVMYRDHCMAFVPDGVTPQVEVSVPLFYQPDQRGTCDFAVLSDDRVVVADLKFGAGVLVDAYLNPQLAIYAMSLVELVDDVYDFTDDTEVVISVFQPRHREAHSAEPWVLTLKDLRGFCTSIADAARVATAGVEAVREHLMGGKPAEDHKSLLPFGVDKRDVSVSEILAVAQELTFVAQEGDHGSCRWCRNKGYCSTRMSAASAGLAPPGHDLSGTDMLAMMPDLDKDEKKLPVEERVAARFETMGIPGDVLTDDYLVRMFAAKKWIESCLSDVGEWLESRALAGDVPKGTKLVLGRAGNRAWVNEEQVDTFLKGQRLKADERYDYKLKSPSKIEAALKDKLAKVTRTRNLFESLVTRSEPKKVLALASDKREAVGADISAMPDLEAIDAEEI